MQGQHARVKAFSHSADYGEKNNLIRAIGLALDEAIDQQSAIVHPPLDGATPRASRAHGELLKLSGAGSICTVPFGEGETILGGVVLARPVERDFDTRDVELIESIGALAGPVLEMKRKDERWLLRKAWDSVREWLAKLIGRGHVGLKLITILLLAAAAFLSVADGEYRVTADAALEGSVQRAVTAPLPGYIAQANVRAGDVVSKGQVLSILEDKDLQLERVKWVSQKEQRLREYSEALARKDRAQVRILGAQVEQAETQISLLDEQISRTRIVAPFDGIVVSGDLSQSLSAPVERGQVLFEIAPLDSYRVILRIDERDVSQIEVGQGGQLALTSLPGEVLPIVVEKLTPVSIAEEGRNYFRGEARVETASEKLRPGMEGVGKIDIDRRSLVWIWTHRLTHWFRHWWWSWTA
jgi:RND family efflux transporter MFP subunit